MRKTIAILMLTVLGVSCQDDKGYYISGNVDELEDGKKVYVSEIGENNRPTRIDSTEVNNGSFELDLEDPEESKLSFLEFEGLNGNVIYISENQNINFDVYRDSLRASRVSGGKENRILYNYLDHLNEVNRKVTESRSEMQQAFQNQDSTKLSRLQKAEAEIIDNDKVFKKKIIKDNKDSFISVMVLADLLSMQSYSQDEIKEMFNELSEDVKQTPLGKNLEEKLNQNQGSSAVDIGSKAPDFSAPTPSGKELSLRDAQGKVTIIDFWAAWCKPCRIENPNVVKTYNKYHDKGLNIIGVSLDRPGKKDDWLQAIEDDGLEWHHVSNLKFWQDPVAQLYGVRAIPATFILDEDGVVVARNLRGQQLEDKIEELLGSN